MATTAIEIGPEPVAIEWQAQTVGIAPNIWKDERRRCLPKAQWTSAYPNVS